MENEKQLTLEEMKSLVSVSTILPALLDKIDKINTDLNALNKKFNDMAVKFNENTNAIVKYKTSVDNFIEEQQEGKEFNSLKKDFVALKNEVIKTQESLNKLVIKFVGKEKESEPEVSEKDKIKNYAEILLTEDKGHRTRTLTKINGKKAFKVDDDVAETVP